jgi:hypothetical protein
LRIESAKPPRALATLHEDAESAELHLVIVLAAVCCFEIRDAIDAEHHRLAAGLLFL